MAPDERLMMRIGERYEAAKQFIVSRRRPFPARHTHIYSGD